MLVNPCSIPAKFNALWLKANFHTHAGDSGSGFPADAVVRAYMDAGYEVSSISNQFALYDPDSIDIAGKMTILKGIEYVSDEDMLCIGINGYMDGKCQDVIDECLKQGGFVVLCHPNYLRDNWLPVEEMEKLDGFAGIEVG